MIVLTHRDVNPKYNTMNLCGVVPDKLCGLSSAEIEASTILVDGRPATLGLFWQVECVEDHRPDLLRLRGDCGRCVAVAGGMQAGGMIVEGQVGDHLCQGMRGGWVEVHGDAGRFAAGGLRGGCVRVFGNVGEFAAGAVPGTSRGMQGGTLIIDGRCDRWLAARMRRGTIIVRGDVAEGAATRMIAGTLVLAGRVVSPLGVGMRRGTLVRLGSHTSNVAENLSGFTEPEFCELSMLPILLDEVSRFAPELVSRVRSNQRRVMRAMGDRCVGGLGECLWFPTVDSPEGDYTGAT